MGYYVSTISALIRPQNKQTHPEESNIPLREEGCGKHAGQKESGDPLGRKRLAQRTPPRSQWISHIALLNAGANSGRHWHCCGKSRVEQYLASRSVPGVRARHMHARSAMRKEDEEKDKDQDKTEARKALLGHV